MLRSSGLVMPEIRHAVKRLVGGSLPSKHLSRRPDDVLLSWLNKRTLIVLRPTAMLQA
jgi:hypothetical protein